MKIAVIGPQHSGTRLFVAHLKLHSQIKDVVHWSVPGGTPKGIVYEDFYEQLKTCDKFLIISRDASCINRSNITKKKMHQVAEKSTTLIQKNIKLLEKDGRINDVVFTSYEQLLQFKEFTLKQIFRNFGLNTENYRYDIKGIYKGDWWTVDMTLKDGNKKYFIG